MKWNKVVTVAALMLTFGCGSEPLFEDFDDVPARWECSEGLVGLWEFQYYEDFPTNETCGVKETVLLNLNWHPMGIGLDFPDCIESLVTADTHVCDDLGASLAWECWALQNDIPELPQAEAQIVQYLRLSQIAPDIATGTHTDQVVWTDPATLELTSCRSEYRLEATKVGG